MLIFSLVPAMISSFLYLLMLLNFIYSFGSSFSNIPDYWSQAQNKYFTTFGNERSIILLNKLLTKFFLSSPYAPDLRRNYSIMLAISCFIWVPPTSRHSSSLSYKIWRPSMSYAVVSWCESWLTLSLSSSVLIFLMSLAFSFSSTRFLTSKLLIYYFFLFLDSLADSLFFSSLRFLASSVLFIIELRPLFFFGKSPPGFCSSRMSSSLSSSH